MNASSKILVDFDPEDYEVFSVVFNNTAVDSTNKYSSMFDCYITIALESLAQEETETMEMYGQLKAAFNPKSYIQKPVINGKKCCFILLPYKH